MVRVEEAEKQILQQCRDFGTEFIPLAECSGRVLAAPLVADRDLPPYNRATMDGIAISSAAFSKGIRHFHIRGTQPAGTEPLTLLQENDCIEIMTGAAVTSVADAVIPYEEIILENGIASVNTPVVIAGQNIHFKGKDCQQNDRLVKAGELVSPAVIATAASVGKVELPVKRLPRVVIVSTGDELVEINAVPSAYQVRRSNNYMLQAVLQSCGIDAAMEHLPDNPVVIKAKLQQLLVSFDVLLLCGGVSKGKFDFIPAVLKELGVTEIFHGVRQRPGKPFWFGTHAQGALLFAFPGNPVSVFLCVHRYFLPWLHASLSLPERKQWAKLEEDVTFKLPLQYFMQVKCRMNEEGQLLAAPEEGNGSGDFANLLNADAFMELPADKDFFRKGESFRIWPFRGL